MDDRWCLVWSNTRACGRVWSYGPCVSGVLSESSKIAEHLANGTPSDKAILIDVFAGAGGNAIAFAKSGRWKRVFAIEQNPQVLACAKHNAEVYGVQDQISWFEGDCLEILKNELAQMNEFGVIFASPPWGGGYYQLSQHRNWYFQVLGTVQILYLTCRECSHTICLIS